MKASQLVQIKEKTGCTLGQFECPSNWANEVIKYSKECEYKHEVVSFWIFEGETIKSGYSICDFINDFTALCSEYLYETETGTFYKIERPKIV
jgi:hypothetical protein